MPNGREGGMLAADLIQLMDTWPLCKRLDNPLAEIDKALGAFTLAEVLAEPMKSFQLSNLPAADGCATR